MSAALKIGLETALPSYSSICQRKFSLVSFDILLESACVRRCSGLRIFAGYCLFVLLLGLSSYESSRKLHSKSDAKGVFTPGSSIGSASREGHDMSLCMKCPYVESVPEMS